MGDRLNNLKKAKALIAAECGTIRSASSIYGTAAWGITEQPDFLNQVLELETSIEPLQLMQQLLDIEERMGRVRLFKMGPRIIDLDILLIDDLIIDSPSLSLPHPALPSRRFALIPLAEIAPDLLHPVEKKTITQLLLTCSDTLTVQKIIERVD